jgi:hypothetical protein
MPFRYGRRERIIEVANRFAVAGLTCLAVAMTGTVLIISEVVIGGWAPTVIAVLVASGFSLLWLVLPGRERASGPAPERVDDIPEN